MEELSIGKRIMMLRKRSGLTQEQLAERLGVTPQAVSKWENDGSCPDISLLPVLADVFGVTTDELLGIKPMRESADKENGSEFTADIEGQNASTEKEAKGTWKFKWDDNGHKGAITFGIVTLLVGVLFLLNRMHLIPQIGNVSLFDVVWPAVLIAFGVSFTIKTYSPFCVGVGALGLYYLLRNLGAVDYPLTWNDIWPILLILFGLQIIVDRTIKKRKKKCGVKRPNTKKVYTTADGSLRMETAFGDDTRVVDSERFPGGKVEVSFASATLDMRQVKYTDQNTVLDVDVSFGELRLLLPKTIRIELSSDKAFGNVSMNGYPNDDASEILYVDGDIAFGSLVIEY